MFSKLASLIAKSDPENGRVNRPLPWHLKEQHFHPKQGGNESQTR